MSSGHGEDGAKSSRVPHRPLTVRARASPASSAAAEVSDNNNVVPKSLNPTASPPEVGVGVTGSNSLDISQDSGVHSLSSSSFHQGFHRALSPPQDISPPISTSQLAGLHSSSPGVLRPTISSPYSAVAGGAAAGGGRGGMNPPHFTSPPAPPPAATGGRDKFNHPAPLKWDPPGAVGGGDSFLGGRGVLGPPISTFFSPGAAAGLLGTAGLSGTLQASPAYSSALAGYGSSTFAAAAAASLLPTNAQYSAILSSIGSNAAAALSQQPASSLSPGPAPFLSPRIPPSFAPGSLSPTRPITPTTTKPGLTLLPHGKRSPARHPLHSHSHVARDRAYESQRFASESGIPLEVTDPLLLPQRGRQTALPNGGGAEGARGNSLVTSSPKRSSTSGRGAPHYPPHFLKGSIIQLASGHFKKVEDLHTGDFVESAAQSHDLRVDSSSVVRIEHSHQHAGTALLSFCVGDHKIQVTVEATLEHPFFVFGLGWSSCSPELTLQRYGLQCHRLKVGDACISLTRKEPPTSSGRTTGVTSSRTSGAATAVSFKMPPRASLSALGGKSASIKREASSDHYKSPANIPKAAEESAADRKRSWSASDALADALPGSSSKAAPSEAARGADPPRRPRVTIATPPEQPP